MRSRFGARGIIGGGAEWFDCFDGPAGELESLCVGTVDAFLEPPVVEGVGVMAGSFRKANGLLDSLVSRGSFRNSKGELDSLVLGG